MIVSRIERLRDAEAGAAEFASEAYGEENAPSPYGPRGYDPDSPGLKAERYAAKARHLITRLEAKRNTTGRIATGVEER